MNSHSAAFVLRWVKEWFYSIVFSCAARTNRSCSYSERPAMIEQNKTSVTIPARLDENNFTHFALFDNFRLKKRWKPPLLFACLMSAFALICFSQNSRKDQAVFMGTVLLCVGLLLPLVWFFYYLFSVRKEARKLGLSREKSQYETQLCESGITVSRGADHADWAWQDLHSAWRVRGCIYLYVQPDRAFLLPEDENADPAWEMICSHLPERKRRDLRNRSPLR